MITVQRCDCGKTVAVEVSYPGVYQAGCPDCLDPTPDASPRAHVYGHGKTAAEALAAWCEAFELIHDELPPG